MAGDQAHRHNHAHFTDHATTIPTMGPSPRYSQTLPVYIHARLLIYQSLTENDLSGLAFAAGVCHYGLSKQNSEPKHPGQLSGIHRDQPCGHP